MNRYRHRCYLMVASVSVTMINTTELILACRKVRDERPKQINTLAGTSGVFYENDGENEIAHIGLNLPKGIYVDTGYEGLQELESISIYLTGPKRFNL